MNRSRTRRPVRRRARAAIAAAAAGPCALLLVLAGCGGSSSPGYAESGGVAAPVDGYGAATSELAVARFLDSAQREDYRGMWSVFGTPEGAAIERFGVQEIEARMVVLSRLLKHDSYELRSADLAGLGEDRARYEVRMRGTRQGDVMVPFVTAHDAAGRWYVERLAADRLSGAGT